MTPHAPPPQSDPLTELPRRPLGWYQWVYDTLYRATRPAVDIDIATPQRPTSSSGRTSAGQQTNAALPLVYVYRLLKSLQRIVRGDSELERVCRRVRDVLQDATQKDVLGEDDDLNIGDLAVADTTTRKLDKALSVRLAYALYQLEVALAVLSSTRGQYDLLLRASDDGTTVEGVVEIVKKIFYREYYRAPAKHGGTHLDLLTFSINIVYRTHLQTRKVLDLADRPVNWDSASKELKAVAKNLSLLDAGEASKKGRHWGKLGFQGDDPSTDFRGSGELGLRHLTQLTANHAMYANRMLAESGTVQAAEDPDMPWYPFALCSIHVTFFLMRLIREGYLQRYLLRAQLRGGDEGVGRFCDEMHNYLLCRAHLDWAQGVDKEEITTVLQFEDFFKEYSAMILDQLTRVQYDNEDFHIGACKWW